MSAMDGVSTVEDYVKAAKELGIKEITITDHDSVQSFPDVSKFVKDEDIKINLGAEFEVYDDINAEIVTNPRDIDLLEAEYVFFDLETTGISPLVNEIIEFGAVKYRKGNVVSKLQMFVKPEKEIPEHISKITNITNEDVKDAPTLQEALLKFKEFVGDAVLVAHNAKFDYSFLDSVYRKNMLGELKNTVVDSLKIS